jgi:hypothetical protein
MICMDEPITRSDLLDDLLIRWANLGWGRIDVGNRLPSTSPSCEGFVASRQWDASELDDEDQARAVIALVYAIGELPSLQQIAISTQARALMLGVSVFTNARLPRDPAERAQLLKVARQELTRRLTIAGAI